MKIIRPITITEAKLVSSTVNDIDYDEWVAGTTYTYDAGNPPRVQYTVGDYHHVYENLATVTDSVAPPSNSTKWILVSAINRWKMFDGTASGQTTAYGTLDVTVLPGEPFDALAFINVNAASVRVVVNDPIDGDVYDSGTLSLADPCGILDWWSYFFEPTARVTDYAVTGLPMYGNATVRVLLTAPADIVVGELVIGRSRVIGMTQYGVQIGIQDYSMKETNAWGEFAITERAYSKRADFTLWVEPSLTDSLQALLASLRTTPVVYVGSDDFASTIVYGFYKDFQLDIAYPSIHACSISVEGLSQ